MPAEPTIKDVTGDGLPDILVPQSWTVYYGDGQAQLLENTGTAGNPSFRYRGLVPVASTPIVTYYMGDPASAGSISNNTAQVTATGDVDGNGVADVMMGRIFLRWPGPSGGDLAYPDMDDPSSGGTEDALCVNDFSRMGLRDLDGDGRLDELRSYFQSSHSKLSKATRVGDMPFTLGAPTTLTTVTGAQIDSPQGAAWADIDGDGHRDLITGGFDGQLRVYRNMSDDASFVAADPVVLSLSSGTPIDVSVAYVGDDSWPAVMDLNGDGCPDLLVADSSKKIHKYLCSAPGLFTGFLDAGLLGTTAQTPLQPLTGGGANALALTVVDYDSDGLDDVICSDRNGSGTWLLRNLGPASDVAFSVEPLLVSRTSAADLVRLGPRSYRVYFAVPTLAGVSQVAWNEVLGSSGRVSGQATIIGGQPATASYDTVLKAPKCSDFSSACDSGSLLVGSGPRGPEPNAPNTINNSCPDGPTGSTLNNRIRVATLDGGLLTRGVTAVIDAWVPAFGGTADFYHTADANNPQWTYVGSRAAGYNGKESNLPLTFVVPTGALQAVRVVSHLLGPSSRLCYSSAFDDQDHDDLVFAVMTNPTRLRIDDVSVPEGNAGTVPATFAVTLSAPSSQTVTVQYVTANGTAVAPGDYAAASGVLTFVPGETTRQLSVAVAGDTAVEVDETFLVSLSNPSNALIGDAQGIGTILDDDALSLSDRELVPGADELQDLAAVGGVADVDYFRTAQEAGSSYEVVVDGISGDLFPLSMELLGADNATVLASSRAIGTGASRSLRLWNPLSARVTSHTIRVSSGGCTTSCGVEDVYRIRFYETTDSIPRFNNSGSQVTVVIVQNPTDYTITGMVHFWSGAGMPLASSDLTLVAKQTLVLNTSSLEALVGKSGTITIAHDGRYGDLVGKSVAIEAATGLSFDSPMLWRSVR